MVTDGEKDVAAATHDNSSLWVEYYSNDGIDPSVKWYKIKNEVRYNLNSQDGTFMLETGSAVVDVNYYLVPVSQQGNRTQLLIQNISDSDFGDYEVEISNSIGSITWKFNFVSRGKVVLSLFLKR